MAEAIVYLKLTRDEVNSKIPYAMICEMRYGARWETGRRRRAWLSQFSEAEREAAAKLFKQAHSWYLVKGVPDTVQMRTSTFALWMKLAEFCGSL